MNKSAILQQDHEDLIRLYQCMTPEERLVAYFYHSQLMSQMYQAGVRYRSGVFPSSKREIPHKP